VWNRRLGGSCEGQGAGATFSFRFPGSRLETGFPAKLHFAPLQRCVKAGHRPAALPNFPRFLRTYYTNGSRTSKAGKFKGLA
jgi:hypothetical protein